MNQKRELPSNTSSQTEEAEGTSHLDHERGSEPEYEVQQQQHDDSGNHDQEETEEVTQEDFAQRSGNEEEESHDLEEINKTEVEENVQLLRRSTRVRKASKWLDTRVYFNAHAVAHPAQAMCSFALHPEEHVAFMRNLDENEVPKSYEEAMKHKVWRNSVGDEGDAMIRNDTWYKSELLKRKKVVSSR